MRHASTAAALAGCLLAAAGCTSSSGSHRAATRPSPAATCQARGGLPDPACTPGAANPAVTQATIATTICKAGWTATVRPPTSYTDRLKTTQMRQYGDTGPATGYEEDHLEALEIGGSPADPRNLWPEPRGGPHGSLVKDRVENAARTAVCSHVITLAAAQAEMAYDWEMLGRTLGVIH